MTTNLITTTETTNTTWKLGRNGHYNENLTFRSEDYEVYEVMNIEDALYYAWYTVPEDMMSDHEEDYEDVKYIIMEETIDGGVQHGVLKQTSHSVEFSIMTEYADPEKKTEIMTYLWVVKAPETISDLASVEEAKIVYLQDDELIYTEEIKVSVYGDSLFLAQQVLKDMKALQYGKTQEINGMAIFHYMTDEGTAVMTMRSGFGCELSIYSNKQDRIVEFFWHI